MDPEPSLTLDATIARCDGSEFVGRLQIKNQSHQRLSHLQHLFEARMRGESGRQDLDVEVSAFDDLPVGIVLFTPDTQAVYINHRGNEILGPNVVNGQQGSRVMATLN